MKVNILQITRKYLKSVIAEKKLNQFRSNWAKVYVSMKALDFKRLVL